MIRHMRHGSPPRLMALQSILSPNRRESLPTPSAGVRMTSRTDSEFGSTLFIDDAETRLERLTQHVAEVVSSWSMAPVVEAYQALRGVAFLTAVTFVAEIGDVRRFETPRQLMAYLGLVPSEHSTGDRVRRGSITKAGNPRAH